MGPSVAPPAAAAGPTYMHVGVDGARAAGTGNNVSADRDVAPMWAHAGVENRAAWAFM